MASFIYFLFIFLSYNKSQFYRIKFSIIISTIGFCLMNSMGNSIAPSLNPFFYLPFVIFSKKIELLLFFTSILIPLFCGFLSSYLANGSLKEYGNPKIKTFIANNSMDLLPIRELKYEI